jgi:hypothetical protein
MMAGRWSSGGVMAPSSRQRVEQTKGRQDAGRLHADNRDRADNVRQEGAEVAKRAGHFADTPAKTRAYELRRLVGPFPNRDCRNAQPAVPRLGDRAGSGRDMFKLLDLVGHGSIMPRRPGRWAVSKCCVARAPWRLCRKSHKDSGKSTPPS